MNPDLPTDAHRVAPGVCPWPQDAPVAFLLDAADAHELKVLTDWVEDSRPAVPGRFEVRMLPIRTGDHSPGGADDPGRRDRLQALLESADPDTVLVPVRISWAPRIDAHQSGPRLRDLLVKDTTGPAPLSRWLRRRRGEDPILLAGRPATVSDLRTAHGRAAETRADVQAADDLVEDFTGFVLRRAEVALSVQEGRLRGRRYKVPRFVIRGMEASRSYRAALDALAEATGADAVDVRRAARKSLDEMVASPSRFFIDWVGALTRWITELGYRQVLVDPDNVERARAAVRDHPAALLWTHKSHMDGIVLLSVLYEHDFPTPHSMGGINMAFGPLGYAGRRSGIIYIRRTFTDDPVYKVALQQYLGYLMEKRFPFSWAFEGTRSRTGKLGRPRYGLLKYVVDAAHATRTRDLHLIPVSIAYDLVVETADYAREESGQAKERESMRWFMRYLNRLRAPKGNIYLRFGEPVVLSGEAPRADPELLGSIATRVAREANALVPVTLPSLMCFTLLGAAPRALTYPELDRALTGLLGWLRERRVPMAESLAEEDLTELASLAETMFSGGVIERVAGGTETVFALDAHQYPVASYYRNTIIHYFVHKAVAETALRRVAEIGAEQRLDAFWAEVQWLRELTRFEFFHPEAEEFAAQIARELSAYEPEWEALVGGSGGDVGVLLSRCTPLVAHAVLLPFLEGYWLVAKSLATWTPEATVSGPDLVGQALRFGQTALRQGRISSRASVGKAIFAGAVEYAGASGLLLAGPEVQRERERLAARLDATIRGVRQIAELAHADLFSLDDAIASPL